MNWIELMGDSIVLREVERDNRVVRVFVKTPELRDLIHASALTRVLKLEVVFERGIVEYSFKLNQVSKPLEIYGFTIDLSGFRVQCYRLEDSGLYEVRVDPRSIRVSSGFPRVDRVVDEISAYRGLWSGVLCGSRVQSLFNYDLILKARYALNYALFRRIKEAWLEYASEYNAFIYSIIHSVLLEKGFNPTLEGLECIRGKCSEVEYSKSVDWRGVRLPYISDSRRLYVLLERMINGSQPDILLSSSSVQLVVECKQGAPKTWLSKAIKQARRYRKYADILVLVASSGLTSSDYEYLSGSYDYVVDECNYKNYTLCRTLLSSIVGNAIT
jgi:hypothetical protein